VPSRPRRVRRSGNFARYLVIPPAVILILSAAIGTQARSDFTAVEWILCATFFAVPTIAIVLSSLVGAWMTDDGVTTRSWFITRRFHAGDVRSFRADEYFGFFNFWPFQAVLRNLVVVDATGEHAIRGLIARRGVLLEMIAELDAHLGIESPATRARDRPAHEAGS